MENQKTTGEFKTKQKFLQFIGAKGRINFIANQALIEGKFLSGLEYEDKTFKLTIYDDGTVDFDDIDGQVTTKQQRETLLSVIEEKTIVPFRKNMVVRELTFHSMKNIDDKQVPLYLSVDYEKPIDKLASIFSDDNVEVSDSQKQKLDMLMSLFDDEPKDEVETSNSVVEPTQQYSDNDNQSIDLNKHLQDSFDNIKKEKVESLRKELHQKKIDLSKFERDKIFAESKITEAKSEIRLLESRIETLQPQLEPNGWYFNVSERLNEKVTLEKEIYETIKSKISKVKGINSEAFMKLFEDGEFHIRLSQKSGEDFVELTDFKNLPNELVEVFADLKLTVRDNKIYYIGEIVWADLVNKFIKLGFLQDTEWEKLCESNSYKVTEEQI